MEKSNIITSLVLVLLLSLNVSVVSAEHTKSNLEYHRPSAHSQEVPVTDLTWTFAPGQSFGINAEAGTVYTVSDPEVISPLDEKQGRFKANKNGEALIFIHQPTLGDFVCRVIVGTAGREQAENPVYYGSDGSGTEETVQESAEVLAQEVLELVNQERAKMGVAPLRLAPDLMKGSAVRAQEITKVFSHTRPDGQPCHSLFKDGIYRVGENIAAGSSTAEAVVEQWMNSPGHRANILNNDYDELGVGHAYDANTTFGHYWVQMFRRPMSKSMIKIGSTRRSNKSSFKHSPSANVSSSAPRSNSNSVPDIIYDEKDRGLAVLAQEVLQLVNAERVKTGVRPLRLSQDLQEAAAIRAEELTRHFSHERPDGSSCFTLLRNRNRTLGENIAAGNATPEEVVDQWMHSPGHRDNILNKDFKELGVGYCRKEGTEYTHYWIQMFRG